MPLTHETGITTTKATTTVTIGSYVFENGHRDDSQADTGSATARLDTVKTYADYRAQVDRNAPIFQNGPGWTEGGLSQQ